MLVVASISFQQLELQATFLKGKSKAAQNLGLKEELEQLEPEALVLRCRRNGLSREGGREVQIQRLVNLHAYLSEDAEPESAPTRPIMPSQEPLPAVSPLPAPENSIRSH